MEHTESISSVPVVNLCLPVGTLINIEGSALYEGSATVVLAVLELGELTFSTSFMLGITSLAKITSR
jgi:Na+/H+-dicarboxylate symporter